MQVGSEIHWLNPCFFFQAEDGIRGAQESRGLGDVYKRQARRSADAPGWCPSCSLGLASGLLPGQGAQCRRATCLLYTSDAADDLLCVDLGGRRIIKKKNLFPDLLCVKITTMTIPMLSTIHDITTFHTEKLVYLD